MYHDWLNAVILGIVEGLTEFLPVSSTGHLLLMNKLLGFEGPASKVFDIVIQLGAILAVVVVYFHRLWNVLMAAPRDPKARQFIFAVLIAFFPAMVIGAGIYKFIKNVLFDPWIVSIAFIVGGFAILWIEKHAKKPTIEAIEDMPLRTALKIGFVQCLAMIPGVSRSGATIMGSLMLGVERRVAAEFSFFLAIPTMAGATFYDLYKNRDQLTIDDGVLIAIGFVVAFFSALIVVRSFVGFVGRHGFAPFAWYRIVAGAVALVALALT